MGSFKELARRVKNKHPEYQQSSDEDVALAVIKRHPEYLSQIDDADVLFAHSATSNRPMPLPDDVTSRRWYENQIRHTNRVKEYTAHQEALLKLQQTFNTAVLNRT